MSLPTGLWDSLAFFLIPAVILFAIAFMTGSGWWLLVPVIAWPLVMELGDVEGGWLNAIVPAFVSSVGVGLGFVLHHIRARYSR